MEIAAVAAVLALAVLAWRGWARARRLARRLERVSHGGSGGRWPLPTRSMAELSPRLVPGEWGPTPRAEVRFVGVGDGVPGGTNDTEAWILAVMARDAREIFEFGTCTGRTAWLLARNAPEDARITTLTLAPEQLRDYRAEPGDSGEAGRVAREESRYTRFYYAGLPEEKKIVQIFCDSKAFDESPYHGRCDLVFVDGSHAYSYVKSDSEKALRMVRPGGWVIWHDYRGPHFGKTRDVFRALNELGREHGLFHVRGTSFVAYRRPEEDGAARGGGAAP